MEKRVKGEMGKKEGKAFSCLFAPSPFRHIVTLLISIDPDVIEPFGVLEDDVLGNVGRHPGKVFLNHFE